jgi:acetoin utilization deacetylase AcuC-like enzyme
MFFGMLKIAYSPIYQHPLPEGHRFPMAKYELIPLQLLHEGTCCPEQFFAPEPLPEKWILRTHDASYWDDLRHLRLDPKMVRRIGFPLSQALVEREITIAQGTVEGCHYARQWGVAFNVAGGTHHAFSDKGEGFCLLNDQAIAANYLLDKELASKILIVDLDVHQGNGTAQIFANEPRVFTFSMHGKENYPLHKERSDLDIALPTFTDDDTYLSILYETLPQLIRDVNPDFLFYLAGVDILATDKLGKLSMSKEGCRRRDEFVLQTAHRAGVPLQISMGGGYSARLADIVDAHCTTFRLAESIFF